MERLQNNFDHQQSNRVADALFGYGQEEAKLKIHNPIASREDSYDVELKLNYLTSLHKEFRKTKNQEERKTLTYVKHEIRRLKGKVSTSSVERFFYSDFMEVLKGWIRGEKDPINFYTGSLKKQEHEIIQHHNLQSLSSQLKKAGFHLEMEGSLRRMIRQNLPGFHLRYADIENSNAHYVVHFKKIPQTNLYYFEKFDAIARPSLDALLKNDINCKRQTFYVQDNLKMSAGEAASLVNNMSVCKTINGKEQWLQLNQRNNPAQPFKTCNFDLEACLSKLPILERNNVQKYQAFTKALKAGGRKEVTILMNGDQLKAKLEAVPQKNTVAVFDTNDRPINLDQLITSRQHAQQTFQIVNDPDIQNKQKPGLSIA